MKEIEKMVADYDSEYYSVEQFIADCKRYIKAIKEGRVIVNIVSVSQSGMSRKMKFLECHKNPTTNKYQYLNFYGLFQCLGYSFGDRDNFQVNGCGMDMVFNTNYSNIHDFYRLGIITKKTCDSLCQDTPTVI